MPLIPNYLTRFRTRSQSTASTAPSLDPPTPAAAPLLDDYQVDSSTSPNDDHGDPYLSLASRAASAPGSSTKSRKSRSIAVDKETDHTEFQPEQKTRIANSDENGSNFISRILSSYSNASVIGRKRSFTVPLTGVLSSSSPQVPQTPLSSPSSNGSYHTPISGSSSPQESPSSAPSGSNGSHKRSSLKDSPGKSLNPRRLRPNQESYKHDSSPPSQHDSEAAASPKTAPSRAMSQSGKDGVHQGRQPRMTETTSNNNSTPLVTAPNHHTQTDTFFTPPRTSTPPPPHRSPNSHRGRQPPNTYPPRSRSRHTFDGVRPVFLSEGHSSSGSSVLFPSFRRMSESLNKMTNSGKPRKEAQIEDVFTDTTTTTTPPPPATTTQNKSSPTGKTFVLSEQRRLSADWSSIEAIRGNTGGSESWPSSVSREMVRLSLKGGVKNGTAGGDRDDELGSPPASPGSKSLASDVDVNPKNPKNPTLFGSIGEDRREFFRANTNAATGKARRGPKVRSSLTQFIAMVDKESAIAEGAESSSAAVTRNNIDPVGHAHVNDSESRSSVASKVTKRRSPPPTLKVTGSGGSSIPFVSVTAPTPVELGIPLRLSSSMSDPGPALDSDMDYTVGSKRKITDAEDEPVSSTTLTPSASAPLNGNANKNSVRSILLTRSESADRPSDASHTSHAPSSFRLHNPKRIRLSDAPPPSQTHSRPTSPSRSPPRTRVPSSSSSPTPSRTGSALRTGAGPFTTTTTRAQSQTSFSSQGHHRAPSVAGSTSIPVLAILTPKAPSIDTRHSLNTYHMRDPSLPPTKRHSKVWKGAATRKVVDEDPGYMMRSRSSLVGWGVERRLFPLQGWAFVVGFIVFPLWWIAAVCPVVWGWGTRWADRRKGYGDPNLVMTEEELQDREILEYDVAYIWRRRCRIMSFFGLFLYIPLIVLLAVLVPRGS